MKMFHKVGMVAVLVAVHSPSMPAQQLGDEVVVPLSDPSRPAVVTLDLVHGGVTVTGTSRRDVRIVARRRDNEPRRRGVERGNLRRLTLPPGIEVAEERNHVSIEGDSSRGPVDFEIEVPLRTDLKLEVVNSGAIVVEGVEGDLELENVNGSITLRQVSGSVVANATNGRVLATLRRIDPQRAMSFTSLNGSVDVTFPASLKANLKLQSDNGVVSTDFDLQLRQVLTTTPNRRGDGRFRIESNKAVYGTINGGGPEIELRSFNGSVFLRKGPS